MPSKPKRKAVPKAVKAWAAVSDSCNGPEFVSIRFYRSNAKEQASGFGGRVIPVLITPTKKGGK